MNVSNRMLLNVPKFQGYSFYRFCVIKGKPTGEGGVKLPPFPPPSPPRLGLNGFADVICISISREAKSVNCAEIKRKK